jgi:DNA-directed RNA polymerase alpha subunit
MRNDLDETLSRKYLIPERYHEYEVFLLEQFVESQCDPRMFSRVVNALRKSNIVTIGQLLNATAIDMIRVKGMGTQSHTLLQNALEKAVATEEWIYELGVNPRKEKVRHDR